MLVGLAFAFLAVCLLNTVGLLLAKFLNNAPITGVRRALGASRKQIFLQHLVEVGVISSIGALLGLALGGAAARWACARSIRWTRRTPAARRRSRTWTSTSVVTALALAFFATIAAGLYPGLAHRPHPAGLLPEGAMT